MAATQTVQEQLTTLADAYRKIVESIPQGDAPEKSALTVDEARVYVGGTSRPTFYQKVLPAVPSYTIGRRRYVLKTDLDTYLRRRIEAGDDLG